MIAIYHRARTMPEQITIESGVAATAIVALVSIIISVAATWYFSKRRYSRQPRRTAPLQEEHIRLAEIEKEKLTNVLTVIAIAVIAAALIGFIALLALFPPGGS